MPDPNAPAPKPANEAAETPEDVATLYSWANLHGAKYRDFSASRAQARELARLRAEEAAAAELRRQEEEAERRRQEEAQIAAREAAEAAEAARQAEAERLAELARQAEAERQAVLAAQEAQRQAAQQRAWQSQTESISSLRETPAAPSILPPFSMESASGFAAQPPVSRAEPAPAASIPAAPEPFSYAVPEPAPPAFQDRFVHAPPGSAAAPRAAESAREPHRESMIFQSAAGLQRPQQPAVYNEPPSFFAPPAAEELAPSWLTAAPASASAPDREAEAPVPSWLAPETASAPREAAPQRPVPIYAQTVGQPQPAMPASSFAPSSAHPPAPANPATQSLQPYAPQPYAAESGSQRNTPSRWFALKSVFDPQQAPAEQMAAPQPVSVPLLAVFSLAGGVGKTSLVASLGRALSARGERVLLVDTTAYGLLPFFFGASDQRPGHLRTFSPPGVSLEAPIQLITLDPDTPPAEAAGPANSTQPGNTDRPQEWLAAEITRLSRTTHRVLVDLPSASGSTTRRILRLSPTVLVPIVPDMNSVVSVGAIESFFRHNGSVAGKQILPHYLLNQFDPSLPLHLDVRELLRQQIGDRLLPFTLRRSPAVSEALAEGMTVIDYAPSSPLAEDYVNLAGWVRSLSAPASQAYRGVRWSER